MTGTIPDVVGRRAQRGHQHRDVEPHVMREYADGRASVDVGLAETAVRPVDDDFVGIRECFLVAKTALASHNVT